MSNENIIKNKIKEILSIYNLYKELKNKDVFKDNFKNNLLYRSIFQSLILGLCCLLDINNKKGLYSIRPLLDLDEINILKKLYSGKDVDILSKKHDYKELVKIYKFIKEWRNKVIAHCDVGYKDYTGSLHTNDIDFIFEFFRIRFNLNY